MTSSWFFRLGALHAILHDGFWKSDYDFLIAFRSNFLSAMHGFKDIEVFLPTGYDVIVSTPPGGAARTFHFHYGFWKSDHDFLIALHSNFISGMHGFRDNVISFQAGCDVIVISSPGGAARNIMIADSERATPILYYCCIVSYM